MVIKSKITHKEIDVEEIRSSCHDRKIHLIKLYREFTGLGLKESKDAIESVPYGNEVERIFDHDAMVTLFRLGGKCDPDPFTKEEFINLISAAIDNMDSFRFKDMLEATQVFLNNVERDGGLQVLARERDNFIERI